MILIVAPLLMGCYNSFDGTTSGADIDSPTPNLTIAELHTIFGEQSAEISSSMVITGHVTATDCSGNFYRSFYIEQEGYAVEILEGIYDSYLRHPVGYKATISLSGLALARSYGVMQIGIKGESESPYYLDYITVEPLIDSHITISQEYAPITPRVVKIGDISAEMCGSLIEIEDVIYSPSEQTTSPATWGGDNWFSDGEGESIIVSCSEYANFADIELPTIEVDICGIVQYDSYDGCYQIKMRDVEDCSL